MRHGPRAQVYTVVAFVEAILAGQTLLIDGEATEAKSLRTWSIARLSAAIFLSHVFYHSPTAPEVKP